MSEDTAQMDNNHSTGLTPLYTVLALLIGLVSGDLKDVYPVFSFILTLVSILSICIIITINLPKFFAVIRSGFKAPTKND